MSADREKDRGSNVPREHPAVQFDPYAAWRRVIREAFTPGAAILWNPNTGLMKDQINGLLANPRNTETTDTYQKVAKSIYDAFVKLQSMFEGQAVLIQIPPIASSKLATILGDQQIGQEAAASASVSAKREGRLPENSLVVEWLSTEEREGLRYKYHIPSELFDYGQHAFRVRERYIRFVASEARGKHFCEADVAGQYLVVQGTDQQATILYPEEEHMRFHFTAEIFGGWREVEPKSKEVIILPTGVDMPRPQPVSANMLATHGQVAAMAAILGQSITESVVPKP